MLLSEHLDTETDPNLVCGCGCGFGSITWHWNPELPEIFEAVRKAAGDRPLLINSGCRCVRHNTSVSGTEQSCHLSGDALDIACPHGLTAEQFGAIADTALRSTHPSAGIGRYPNLRFIHVDTGRGKDPGRRWTA